MNLIKLAKSSLFIIFISTIFNVNNIGFSSAEKDELFIELKFIGTGYQLNKSEEAQITFSINIKFIGESPPKYIKIGDTKKTPILDNLYPVTEILGPWMHITNNIWGLSEIEDNTFAPIELPPFSFELNTTNKEWPNEELVKIFYIGYSYLRDNNAVDTNIHLNVFVNTPDPNDVLYHSIAVSFVEKWEPIIYNQEIWHVSSHRLTLSHQKTQAQAFTMLPLMMNYIYPFILFMFAFLSIIHFITQVKDALPNIFYRINVDIGHLLRAELSIMASIITFIITTKNMIPYWYSNIYIKMNNLFLFNINLIILTFLISVIKKKNNV